MISCALTLPTFGKGPQRRHLHFAYTSSLRVLEDLGEVKPPRLSDPELCSRSTCAANAAARCSSVNWEGPRLPSLIDINRSLFVRPAMPPAQTTVPAS